jgi:hypothetical protein
MVKSIGVSIDFTAKRFVWQRMIQGIIRAMLIAMNIWRSGHTPLRRAAKLLSGMPHGIPPSDSHYRITRGSIFPISDLG